MSLHVAVVGPIATDHLALHLTTAPSRPLGNPAAPLIGILIGELLRAGFRVSAITTDPALHGNPPVVFSGPSLDFTVCPARPRAWRLNGFRPGRALDAFAFERAQVRRVLEDCSPDIVHAHWTYEYAAAALSTGFPHLVTCHDSPWAVLKSYRNPYRAVRYFMARSVLRRGCNFTAVSPYLASEVRCFTRGDVRVIPNPIAEYVAELGRPRALGGSRRVAMVCNGWSRLKNPEAALMGFSRFKARNPHAELHLYGADFGENEIANRWAGEGQIAAGMFFHGATPHRELASALAACDALLHPALEESFGVVVAEALALGLPVVAGRQSGAVPWVVGQHACESAAPGILVDVRRPDEIETALQRVFDQEYQVRSQAGFSNASFRFGARGIALQYAELYQSIVLGTRMIA